MKQINDPAINSVVYYENKIGGIYPVLITGGKYLSNGLLSNFWDWRKINDDCSLGELEHGYGNFYDTEGAYIVKHTIVIEKAEEFMGRYY
jgi:hypothetical protein